MTAARYRFAKAFSSPAIQSSAPSDEARKPVRCPCFPSGTGLPVIPAPPHSWFRLQLSFPFPVSLIAPLPAWLPDGLVSRSRVPSPLLSSSSLFGKSNGVEGRAVAGGQPDGTEEPLGRSRSPPRPHCPPLCHECLSETHLLSPAACDRGLDEGASFRAWPRALPSQPSAPRSRLLAGCRCPPGGSGVPAAPGAEAHLSHRR